MMMEESDSEYLMWMKRKQILKSHLAGGVGDGSSNNNNINYYSSWEERAFAEDAARVLGGSIWPPRSYSCTFCKREFRSAQALGGHMNVHRRDRARLKQNLSPHHHHHHHKIDCNYSLGNHQLSASQSSHHQIDCCLNPHSASPANNTTVTTTRLSSSSLAMSTVGENCGQGSAKISSSIIMLHERVVNARRDDEDKFKGFLLGCNNYVETSLSVGLSSSSMFGQKSPTILPCGDRAVMSCKRVKTSISSMPVMKFLKPCSNDRGLAFQQSAEVILGGVNHHHPGIVEDLDLELRLGKQQKVK